MSKTTKQVQNYQLSPPQCTSSSSVEAKRPSQHIIGHFEDDFYRPDDQTSNIEALQEKHHNDKIPAPYRTL